MDRHRLPPPAPRPARGAANYLRRLASRRFYCARRRRRFVGIAVGGAFAERRTLEREIGAAHARPRNRLDADQARVLAHGAGFKTGDLGLAPPRLALGIGPEALATPRQRDERDGPEEKPAQPARHARRMRAI